jgi:hypothetical protein
MNIIDIIQGQPLRKVESFNNLHIISLSENKIQMSFIFGVH